MNKIIVVLLLITSNLIAQTNSKFVYGLTAIVNKDSKVDEMMKSMNLNYENLISGIEFNLITNDTIASFSINKKTVPDDGAVQMFLTLINYSGVLNQTKEFLFTEKKYDHLEKTYTITDIIYKNWQILEESKEIMGYKCYKAVGEKITINDAGKFSEKIVAWFCPSIPLQYGPMGYGNLPGLIFELQTKKALYGLKKIEYNSNESVALLNKNNISIKYDDFVKIIKESREKRKQMMNGN